MDLLTILGIVSGMGLITGAILMKTSFMTFFDFPSLMIVLGGTFASTCISFSGKAILSALKDMVTTLFKHQIDYLITIQELEKLAKVTKVKGKVALEKVRVENQFMRKGVSLVATGLSPNAIMRTMTIEKQTLRSREVESQEVLEKMGDLSPAWGMVGTLIGLVIMMLTLDDPSSIGPSMAIALLTTFYGAILANLFFIPAATKIEHRSAKSLKHHNLIIEGIISIAANESPSMIKEKLMGFLTADESEAASGKK